LIEKAVAAAECNTSIALVGAGGIGKTSVALTVLHDDRIKKRFGDNRRFVRCDGFPASALHFLRQLSKAIGAGFENPEDLTPLRTFLSSRNMFIVLDNIESVIDPSVTEAEKIYKAVEELSQLNNICLFITSRIPIIPPECERLDIQTLSKEAACDTFHRIYQHGERSDLINNVLEQLDFHPLSITLLATVAHHSEWNPDRLAREWAEHCTDLLHTNHEEILAAAIELSLSSLMSQELGPDARDLLGVIAFFPQGIYENNIDGLFPTITNRKNIFDKFCVLSLAYRSNGFITMLAPIRHHLSPKDPASASLLCSIKDHYISRLSVNVTPGEPGYEETRWITSEDMNIEHLLDVFTSIDGTSDDVWSACGYFMGHLVWHKPRLVMLGRKIEALVHPSRGWCLFNLAGLFRSIGNYAVAKQLLTLVLEHSREQVVGHELARTLRELSDVNFSMGLFKEGIKQAREAAEINGQLGDKKAQAYCFIDVAWFLHNDHQLDAAEEAASRATDLLEEGDPFLVSQCYQMLGAIYCAGGERTKAIHNLEIALGIASSVNCFSLLSSVHLSLASTFAYEDRFDDAHTHVEHAKLYAANDNDTHLWARSMFEQAKLWYGQRRFGEAKSGALGALEAFEKLGAANDSGRVWEFLRRINSDTHKSVDDGELSIAVLLIVFIDSLCSDSTDTSE
jgi:tetratricopeptide (TPR) repeat protein